jgi:hypothetical protein
MEIRNKIGICDKCGHKGVIELFVKPKESANSDLMSKAYEFMKKPYQTF